MIIALLILIITGQAERWWKVYNQATLEVTIRQNETNELLSESIFLINSQKGISNKKGLINLEHLQAGDHQLKVEKVGFSLYQSSVTLLRGKNKLPDIYLEREPQKEIIFKGIIKDKITEKVISSAIVKIDDEEILTDNNGEFNLSLLTGKHELVVTKDSYQSLKQSIEVGTDSEKLDYLLIPKKTIYFISNRDGKRGIYSANLDGTSQTRVVSKSSQGEEENLIIAPNYQAAIFTSTRDGLKDNAGNKIRLAYYLDFKTNILDSLRIKCSLTTH